ncbi:MAG: tetratricopeptide repeat protein [Streptosporangiaceae bacterium]
MTQLLAEPDGLAHVLSGLGGTGKSMVALRVADVAVTQGRRVWWVSAVDGASLSAGMLLLAESLGADAGLVQGARAGAVPACDVLWPLLEADPGWLLVIDNADDVEALAVTGRVLRDGNGWVRGSRSGLVLVTTRDSDPSHWGRAVELHPVGWLTDADGGLVLRDLAPQAGTQSEAESLSGRLGGLALALHHAGSHLAMPFARLRTFTAYQQAWEEEFAAGTYSGTPSDRDVVTSTWDLSLDQLDRSGFPQARNLLDVLAWFAAPIPVPTQGLDHEVLGRVCGDTGAAAVAPGLQALLSAGLIETRLPSPPPGPAHAGTSGVMVHPLVAETIRSRHLARGTAPTIAGVAVDVLAQATNDLQNVRAADWAVWIVWLPHLEELLTQASSHLGLEDLAALAGTAADGAMALLWAGSYPASLKVAETARQHTQRLGAENPEILFLIDRQAGAYYFLGDHAEAERLYRELLPIEERVLGPEHPDTLTTRYEIARAIAGQGDHAEAERLYRELLPTRERVLGSEHPSTLNIRYAIARAVAGQGDHAEAERLYRELLPTEGRVLGPEHPDTLTTRRALGS